VDSHITQDEDKEEERDHIKRALEANGYQPWILRLPDKRNKDNSKDKQTTTTRPRSVALPYIKGLSETLQRLFFSRGIPTYHKPFNTIKNILVKPKDSTPKENQCGLVYHIKCQDCNENYVGETGRNLGVRFKEHTTRKNTNSAIKEHLTDSGHKCSWDDVKILDKEENWFRRRIKEAIQIQKLRPSLNRDMGHELAPVYNTLLSRDRYWSRDNAAPSQRH
jgi:hypothetical protein